MKKRAQTDKALFMLIGVVLAAVMVLVLIGFVTNLGNADEKDYTKGVSLLHLKLRYYEENVGKVKYDDTLFTLSKDKVVIFFNKDMNPNEEKSFNCKYNSIEEYTSLSLKGWQEGDIYNSKDIIIKTKKPIECQGKSCMCLAKLDVAAWNEFREKDVWNIDAQDSIADCFFYKDLVFKNTDKDTFVCDGIAIINAHIGDGQDLLFNVKTSYKEDSVTVNSPIMATSGRVSTKNPVRYEK